MKTKVKIYWDIETVDKYGDIIDHDIDCELKEYPLQDGMQRLVLVRDVEDEGGILDRTWAYIENDKLPDYFTDTLGNNETKVPKRYFRQLKEVNNTKL